MVLILVGIVGLILVVPASIAIPYRSKQTFGKRKYFLLQVVPYLATGKQTLFIEYIIIKTSFRKCNKLSRK